MVRVQSSLAQARKDAEAANKELQLLQDSIKQADERANASRQRIATLKQEEAQLDERLRHAAVVEARRA